MTSTATAPNVTVVDPDAPEGSPAYDGLVHLAGATLEPGAYPATYVHADGETWSGELVVVSATFAHFAPAERVATGAGYCSGCGETFTGTRGLTSHRSRPFLALGCRA